MATEAGHYQFIFWTQKFKDGGQFFVIGPPASFLTGSFSLNVVLMKRQILFMRPNAGVPILPYVTAGYTSVLHFMPCWLVSSLCPFTIALNK